jgi:hypothetical protein
MEAAYLDVDANPNIGACLDICQKLLEASADSWVSGFRATSKDLRRLLPLCIFTAVFLLLPTLRPLTLETVDPVRPLQLATLPCQHFRIHYRRPIRHREAGAIGGTTVD